MDTCSAANNYGTVDNDAEATQGRCAQGWYASATQVAHVHASQLDVSSAFHGGFHAADRVAAAVFAA